MGAQPGPGSHIHPQAPTGLRCPPGMAGAAGVCAVGRGAAARPPAEPQAWEAPLGCASAWGSASVGLQRERLSRFWGRFRGISLGHHRAAAALAPSWQRQGDGGARHGPLLGSAPSVRRGWGPAGSYCGSWPAWERCAGRRESPWHSSKGSVCGRGQRRFLSSPQSLSLPPFVPPASPWALLLWFPKDHHAEQAACLLPVPFLPECLRGLMPGWALCHRPCHPQPVFAQLIVPGSTYCLALVPVEFHPIFSSPFLQFVKIILNSNPVLQDTCSPSQLRVICKFNKRFLYSIIQVLNENTEQTRTRASPRPSKQPTTHAVLATLAAEM